MSKYNRGDQFWFEITDVIERGSGEVTYLCSNTIGHCTEKMLDKFNRVNPEEKEEKADWWSDGYCSGLEDAWEAARKITALDELKDVFGTMWVSKILRDNTASEAISKIQDYEKKKKEEAEIKVGDEVIERLEKSTITFVVFGVSRERVFGFTKDGSWNACYKENARKTGRHFPEIAEVQEQMKTDEHTDTD